MMEIRKQKEIEYYDNHAEEWLREHESENSSGDFEGFKPGITASYEFCYQLLEKYCPGKKILDYGCGNGVHSAVLAKNGNEVIGIDLSEKSLEIARKKVANKSFKDKLKFIAMDCEKLDFPDNSFDVIFDGGTFSSIDLNKALPELARVLKPGGILIGIETFGHNPIANLKRRLNKLTGKRTEWAAEHIFSEKGLELVNKYFGKTDVHYFHIISWVTFSSLGLPGGKFFLRLLERVDNFLFKFPFLRKYAFKAVFVFSLPKK